MLYENYQKKLKRIATGISIVVKTMPIILISIAVLTVIVTSLVVAKGSVGSVSCPDELIYGEELECKAFGMLSKVTFEYCKVGTLEWTTEAPQEQGEYLVRAVGNTSFGGKRYSEAKTITISPKKIEVSVLETSIVYGEMPTPGGDILAGESIICESFSFADVTAEKTDITPDQNSIKIINENGKDITDCYTVVAVTRSVNILPRPVSITVEDYTAIYNGKECYFDKYEISEGSLKDGDVLSSSFSDKLIEVGNVENAPSFKVLNTDGNDVTHLYSLNITNGKLAVDKRPLIITTNGFEETYTGAEQYLNEYVANAETPLVEGHRIVTVSYSKFTDAGDYTNAMSFKIVDGNDNDMSANYALTVIEGAVKIKPKKVTITTPTDDWTYDGFAHYNIEFASEGLVEGHRAIIFMNFFPTLTDVGKVKNEFTVAIVDDEMMDIDPVLNSTLIPPYTGPDIIYPDELTDIGANDVVAYHDFTSNYDIEYVYGTIEVKKRPIVIKPEDVKRTYDGTTLSPQSIVVSDSSANPLTPGCSISGQMTGELLEAGEGVSEIVLDTVKIVLKNNQVGEKDVTQNYAITTEKGSIEVGVRDLVIKTKSETFMYDGKAHSSLKLEEGFTLDLAEGDVLTIVSGPSVTNVVEGEIVNEFSEVTIKTAFGKDDRYDSYNLIYDSGTISVYPRKITITTQTVTDAVYNGKKQYFEELSVSGDGIAEGQTIQVTQISEFEDAMDAEEKNELYEFKIYNSADPEQKDTKDNNYVWQVEPGHVRINKRPITVITEGHSWDYNGNAHYWIIKGDGTSAVRVNNLAEDHDFGIVSYPSVIDYSDEPVKNKVDIKIYVDVDVDGDGITDEVQDKTQNYEISEDSVYGDLIINKIPLTITTPGDTWTYDGLPHSLIDGVQVSGYLSNEEHKHDYRIADYPTITNVKESCKNKIEIQVFEIVDGVEVDKTHNYFAGDESEYGDLVIKKRPIKIRTQQNLGVIYNGEIQQFKGFEVLADSTYLNVAPNQIFEVISATPFEDVMFNPESGEVISAENEILEFVIYYDNDTSKTDVAENYDVAWDVKQVQINPRIVTVHTYSKTYLYDGKPHSCRTEESLLLVENLAFDHKYKIASCPTVQNYTENPVPNEVKIEIYRIGEDGKEIDKTANYIFDETFGTLAVEKRKIIIVTETNRDTVYDGKEHTFTDPEKIYFRLDGIAENQSFIVEESTSLKYVTDGVQDNVYSKYKIVDSAGKPVTGNYQVVDFEYGKIELQKRTVIIVTDSFEHVYDAQEVSSIKWTYHVITEYEFVDIFTVGDSTKVKNVNRADVHDFVGSYYNVFDETTWTVTDKAGVDRIGNYEIIQAYGDITIIPRPIQVTSKGDEIEYNGKELTKSEYNLTAGNLVSDHAITPTYTGVPPLELAVA